MPVWESEFWNRSLGRSISLGLREPLPLFQENARLDWASGRIAGAASPAAAVVDPRFTVQGRLLATTPTLALYTVAPPLRLASAEESVYRDGWTGGRAALDGWTPASAVDVTLSRAGWPKGGGGSGDRELGAARAAGRRRGARRRERLAHRAGPPGGRRTVRSSSRSRPGASSWPFRTRSSRRSTASPATRATSASRCGSARSRWAVEACPGGAPRRDRGTDRLRALRRRRVRRRAAVLDRLRRVRARGARARRDAGRLPAGAVARGSRRGSSSRC